MERSWVSSPAYRLIIERLVASREGQGVGQRELARRLGKHPSWLNKIERLERRLDLLEFLVIARAIGVSPSEFVGEIDQELPANIQV